MSDALKEIESIIAAAKFYVLPSEDLRANTLQAARDFESAQQAMRSARRFVVGIGLLVFLMTPMMDRVVQIPVPQGPSSSEMFSRASECAAESDVGNQWGMVEAFTRLRQAQASPHRVSKNW